MNYPKFEGDIVQRQEGEGTALQGNEVDIAPIDELYEQGAMIECLKIANEVPGIEYESVEDYLSVAERFHRIITTRNWRA